MRSRYDNIHGDEDFEECFCNQDECVCDELLKNDEANAAELMADELDMELDTNDNR